MIKRNKKICSSCNTPQYIFSKGRCKFCSQKEDYKPINKQSKKNKVKKAERSKKRSVYFDYHINLCTHSENSGQVITYPSRANICHILDKGRHPSLEDNKQNYIYLTLEEHSRFDELLFRHKFEKIKEELPKAWEIVLERLRIIIPLCKEQTKLKLALEEII